jgi:hypothetical protein
MMLDTAILTAQTAQVAAMAVWLGVALRDNITAPRLNADSISEIMALDVMARQYPHHYTALQVRRVTDPARVLRLFRMIVAGESLVVLALAVATVAMVLALAGVVAAATAKALALLAVAGFTAIWIAFLIGGNHFVYWLCHGNAQRTHFDLLLWGLGTQLFLALA